ncbi:MAG: hypothetical protein RSP_21010 [Rhodanobacter sp.]
MTHSIALEQAPVDEKRFANIDRRMALAFGLLIFSLMLAVLLAGGWYARTLLTHDRNRQASATAHLLADVLGRADVSGKHPALQLLQRMQEEQPGFAYLRLLDRQGTIIADSNPHPSDIGKPSDVAPLIAGAAPAWSRDVPGADGTQVREISVPYRNRAGEIQGVLQIGTPENPGQASLRKAVFLGFVLLGLLLLVGILATSRISRNFGQPMRRLAANMARERLRLANILDAMHAGTWEWHVATDKITPNQRWAEIMGYTLEELQPVDSRTFERLGHPEDLARRRESIEEHLAGRQESYACEIRMRHKMGHWVWVLDSGRVAERSTDGRPLCLMGASLDITKRKRAEEALREESERFVALARISNTGVWEWDDTTGTEWASPEYFSMLGRRAEDFPDVSDVWLKLIHPDDKERATRSFAAYLAGGSQGMYETEFRLQHANGEWVWIWSRGSALRDADERPTGKTLGTHINVTSLKQAQAVLRESQEHLRLISDNLPDTMVFQLDCGESGELRRFTYLSDGVQRLYGLSTNAVLRDASLLHAKIVPEDRRALDARERECIAQLKDFSMEVRCSTPDGRMRWIMITSSPRRTDDGHVVFDGLEIDITERKRHEEKTRELNTLLEQRVVERTAELSAALDGLRDTRDQLLQSDKLASLGALVAGVAHELNTPIGTAVTVASTLVQTHKRFRRLAESGLTRSALAEYLGDVEEGGLIIERSLARAAELIGGFKQLAVDQTSYQRRSFTLDDVVQEIAMTMRPALRKTPFELHTEIPQGLALDSFPGPLGQVLINLINNAIVHAFEGRDRGSIALHAAPAEEDWVTLTVGDDGIGISAQNQPKVFDPFFTTKLGKGGSGLGLHITYTLVTGLLGGRIELESTPEQGSRFILHLPLVAPALANR